jgi:hypothetical protein
MEKFDEVSVLVIVERNENVIPKIDRNLQGRTQLRSPENNEVFNCRLLSQHQLCPETIA